MTVVAVGVENVGAVVATRTDGGHELGGGEHTDRKREVRAKKCQMHATNGNM